MEKERFVLVEPTEPEVELEEQALEQAPVVLEILKAPLALDPPTVDTLLEDRVSTGG